VTRPRRAPHLFVVAVTAELPVHLRVLTAARLARLRLGEVGPVVLEVDRPSLDTLAELIDTARHQLDHLAGPAASQPVSSDE
jgi:hypothetical protein